MRHIARTLLACPALLATTAAHAQDWKQKIKVVGFSSVSAENQAATESRYKDVAMAFKERTGVDMRIYTASDYAGTGQALPAGQIPMAQVGARAYASAWIDSNGGVEPLVANKDLDGALVDGPRLGGAAEPVFDFLFFKKSERKGERKVREK